MRIKSRRAFTLLELVLVIAILVLFVLLLIPAFHRGKTLQLTPEAKSTPVPEATPEPVIAPLPEEKADPVLPLPAPEKAEPAPPAPEPDGKPNANPKEVDGATERLNKEVAERIERKVAAIIIPLVLIGGTLWLAFQGASLNVSVTSATGDITSYTQPVYADGVPSFSQDRPGLR